MEVFRFGLGGARDRTYNAVAMMIQAIVFIGRGAVLLL